jgi:hypothetical protein
MFRGIFAERASDGSPLLSPFAPRKEASAFAQRKPTKKAQSSPNSISNHRQGYDEALDAHLTRDREIELAAGKTEADLGVLMLSRKRSATSVKIERSKTGGVWVDIADCYGRPAPRWHITDPRRIAKNAQVADFRGKWLLIYYCPNLIRAQR